MKTLTCWFAGVLLVVSFPTSGVLGQWSNIFLHGHQDSALHELSSNATKDSNHVDRSAATTRKRSPNLLMIVTDQQRFDALGFVQNQMSRFEGKIHIRTPNIDALAERGIYFRNAYCVSPSCGPSRAGIKTGCTIQRTGILQNKCFNAKVFRRMRMIEQKIERMVSFEQLLVEEKRFVAETYGKWHSPFRLYFERHSKTKRVIAHDVYNKQGRTSFQKYMNVKEFYLGAVKHMVRQDGFNVNAHYEKNSQKNDFSGMPYTPIQLDSRYGYPAKTPLNKQSGFDDWALHDTSVCGVENVPSKYSATAVIGRMAVKALKRLAADKNQPFLLSVHFNAPHPPMVASPNYFSYYYDRRKQLFVAPSIKDPMINSAYVRANQRRLIPKLGRQYPYDDKRKIKELTASYYAMIEQVDEWVGKLMKVLRRAKIGKHTMVIFTSDHGEMMGAHGMIGKAVLLEEAVHIPLVISLPGKVAAGTTVSEPVSQLDLHATVLDYLGAGDLDKSDGRSLRRFIERSSYNRMYDDRAVVVELDSRYPVNQRQFSGKLGRSPNFMIRKGPWKLIITKLAASPVLDMMYNLDRDPYETKNVLGRNGKRASVKVIGKAEHLKILLLEWMRRMNGPHDLYSDRKYNLNQGAGDINEITKRRTWRKVDFWVSDASLSFGPVVRSNGKYVRYEYLYVGRTLHKKKPLRLSNIRIGGKHANLFSVNKKKATIAKTGYVRIRVALISSKPIHSNDKIDAWVEIKTNYRGIQRIPIVIE